MSDFNASNYAGHSYRIGAATTAAEVNLPLWLIKTMGRWLSDCFTNVTLKHLFLPRLEYQPCLPITHPNFNIDFSQTQ